MTECVLNNKMAADIDPQHCMCCLLEVRKREKQKHSNGAQISAMPKLKGYKWQEAEKRRTAFLAQKNDVPAGFYEFAMRQATVWWLKNTVDRWRSWADKNLPEKRTECWSRIGQRDSSMSGSYIPYIVARDSYKNTDVSVEAGMSQFTWPKLYKGE